jgi:hypothetical protein
VDGLLLRNVTVEGASLGISCNSGPCASWWLENVKVTNAVGSGSGADTIAIEEGENIGAINVETTHASADGIDLKARQVLILNSYVHHIQRNGIKLWYGGDIINTIVEHTGADAALVFKEPGHYRVLHSLVAFHNFQKDQSYNLTAGYDTSKKLNVEIVNSIFYNTAGGMFFSNHTKVNINHSLFYGMENKKVLRAYLSGREIEVMLQQSTAVFDKVGLGNNVRFADPQFIKPRTSNFFLKATSPAINRGRVTEAYPKTDRRGELRIKGGAPDIGPYEIR